MTGLTVTFFCDYAEEGWPSMDLIGALLPEAVQRADPAARVERCQPRARRWSGRPGGDRWAPTIRERLINRYIFYPRSIRQHAACDHVFHVLDHSYAHLVHGLPASRTIVTCHDLDAFACVLDRTAAPRPWLFRQAVQRTMSGLRRAARVACVSRDVREALVRAGIVDMARTAIVPNGVHPAFTTVPDPADCAEADRLLGSNGRAPVIDLLHVGLPVPRKRIDVAIQVLARVRQSHPEARLVRVGGTLTPELQALATRLGLAGFVRELPFVPPGVLAAVYRRASLLLVPSDREGFSLPIVEALSSGTPVIANDIPVLRETGGDCARYRPNDNVEGWCAEVDAVLSRVSADLARWQASARRHARGFSWGAAAERLLPLYRELDSR